MLHFGTKIFDLRALCCILELKSLMCMPTWRLAFGCWLLVFVGFLALVSLGFWLLAFVGYWFLFCVAFYLIHTFVECVCSIVVCIYHFIISYNTLHMNCM